jgi:hypothetical protein
MHGVVNREPSVQQFSVYCGSWCPHFLHRLLRAFGVLYSGSLRVVAQDALYVVFVQGSHSDVEALL